ncbi:hypothetical protein GIB67_035191 [Kingdonia uniflora]|uniref:HSF-type DNA-binding domain-containing protein n=1 Tax=Kingdonia uniflora TaxID=39325 RepID=A0A7J7LE17_9MAGN|nr:hypothetical protein GIB67_035191 [Kingdonia uniflora]
MMEAISAQKEILYYVKKSSPPPFLLKTFMLVEDPVTDEIVSWNTDGSAFVVWQIAEFSRDLLPTLFKHSNFSSFVRQLNTYGFRKVVTSRWEFSNEMFRKGEKDLLRRIHRRKAWETKPTLPITAPTLPIIAPLPLTTAQEADEDQDSSSNSSSSGYSTLLDENKRLKMENGVLSSELSNMKIKCKKLFDMVTIHTNSENITEDDDKAPRLFGVRLDVQMKEKRKRSSDEIRERVHVLLSQPCK